MKTWIDKLRELDIPQIEQLIEKQECEIKISQRDLETLQRVLNEKREQAMYVFINKVSKLHSCDGCI